MDYKVLYRKYRPADFNHLVGQDSIKKILVNSIINDKIAHAYILLDHEVLVKQVQQKYLREH